MLNQLYTIADKNQINVYHFPLAGSPSLALPNNIAIDTNQIDTSAQETVCLAHELGHCLTSTFYTFRTLETRDRMEYRANKWAFQKLIPFHELKEAVKNGIVQPFDLAEYFNVTEPFLKKAVDYYRNTGKEFCNG